MDWLNTPRSSNGSSGPAEAEFGESRRLSTARSDRLCLDSRYLNRPILMRLNNFSLLGLRAYSLFSCLVQTLSLRAIPCFPILFRMRCLDPVWSAEERLDRK